MWNLKYGTNEPIYETERDSWICVCQGKVGEGEGWTGRVGLVTAVTLEWINKILMYSPGNYIL